ncbi:MAG TPA: nicotinate phosphoribosyltransferase [Acidimicrobiales bacterium]|nr:nicotinate phosphoribosyltransferase [Acidimicrobiales bacterium]
MTPSGSEAPQGAGTALVSVATAGGSTALLTDHYELTMLAAALRSGVADRPATFEVFTRRLPPGRRYGVVAGVDRFVEALDRFRFGADELGWLDRQRVVDAATLEWLERYRFGGTVHAYGEGELHGAGSPIVTVEASFGEAVLLETLALSILNHDSAIAAAAARIAAAAGDRPVIEMGTRRTDPEAAVAAARVAYLTGFTATSNLEAGRRHGIPTTGTAAHAFTLAHASERDAFAAQIATLGTGTTLLVDTYDVGGGIRTAVEVAGRGLGAVRIDSGDLADEAVAARALLDRLGATATRVVITGDLDDRSLRALRDAPADAYGVGTNVVTGLGAPSAGFVYKLVSLGVGEGGQQAVAKLSPGKATVGGRKQAWRVAAGGASVHDLVGPAGASPPVPGRPLLRRVVDAGDVVDAPTVEEARAWHAGVRAELPAGVELGLRRW